MSAEELREGSKSRPPGGVKDSAGEPGRKGCPPPRRRPHRPAAADLAVAERGKGGTEAQTYLAGSGGDSVPLRRLLPVVARLSWQTEKKIRAFFCGSFRRPRDGGFRIAFGVKYHAVCLLFFPFRVCRRETTAVVATVKRGAPPAVRALTARCAVGVVAHALSRLAAVADRPRMIRSCLRLKRGHVPDTLPVCLVYLSCMPTRRRNSIANKHSTRFYFFSSLSYVPASFLARKGTHTPRTVVTTASIKPNPVTLLINARIGPSQTI
jgi:hypothetical protein